jgi:hypothetical protein
MKGPLAAPKGRAPSIMAEGLSSLVSKQRLAIIAKWFDSAVRSYAPDTAAFLRSQKDPFANPVGNQTRTALEALFDELAGEMDAAGIARSLDPIMRIRAVQSLAPSHAVAFVFALKGILREVLGTRAAVAALAELDARIDAVGLAAFDVYMACREQIMELKANETRNRVFRAFKKAGLVAGEDASDPGADPERSTT